MRWLAAGSAACPLNADGFGSAFYGALSKQDWKGVSESLKKGFVSDYWFASAGGVAEDG